MGEGLNVVMFGQKRLTREGGVEIVVKELCTRMAQQGCVVTCYNRSGHHVSGAEYDSVDEIEYGGITQKYVPTIEKKGLAAVSSSFFAALYSAFGKYDVVHIHAEGPAFFSWLPKVFGKRVVVTIHGIDWQREKWKSGFGSKFIRQGEKNAVKYSLINQAKALDTYDYYMFSDHDDVWYPDKIEKMVEAASKQEINTPVMVYANMQIIDGNGNVTEDDINKKLVLKCRGQWDLFYSHRVYGCNSLFNRALFNIVPKVEVDFEREIIGILCHDNYYAKFASVYGKLVYLDKITMSYRRYGKNVTAAQSYDYGIKRILKRVRGIDTLATTAGR